MARFILDFSGANINKNNIDYTKRMIDELKEVDTGKHEVIIKWQLFEKAGSNIPLMPDVFEFAYDYAEKLGYKTTASVFDKNSLDFLLDFDVPFVKIANNRKLDWIIGEVPRKIPVYASFIKYSPSLDVDGLLCCISDYPSNFEEYEDKFYKIDLMDGISDHTTNWRLFNKYKPKIYECHYKLDDSTGLDAGEFARTPNNLSEVL